MEKLKTAAQLRKWLEGKNGPVEIWGTIDDNGTGLVSVAGAEFRNYHD